MQQRLRIDEVEAELVRSPRQFLVTGGAGFIGSHLVERLLQWGQQVRVVDNFATGKRANLPAAQARFELIEGSVDNVDTMARACAGVDVVLHQAALGSVPRSIKDPLPTHRANVDGFAITVLAAQAAKVQRVVYASSSSVYGDEPNLPKREDRIGRPLSPYAASKRVDEILGGAYADAYGLGIVGLRYFNVFGPRQDPQGEYAAVIPRFVQAMLAEIGRASCRERVSSEV